MMGNVFCISISPRAATALGCSSLFAVLWATFWGFCHKSKFFYFDPQDFTHYEQGGNRKLPVSAATSTFAPHLKGYISATKLLLTVAAASIAFGANQTATIGIFLAKIILAFSVLYGTAFVALLQFFYEQYAQNVGYYVPWRYSIVQALGFSSLVSFVVGYLVWAFNRIPPGKAILSVGF